MVALNLYLMLFIIRYYKTFINSCRQFTSGHGFELVRGTAVGSIVRIIGSVASFGVLLSISRLYGASGTGVYAIVFSVWSITGLVCTAGMQRSAVRFVAETVAKTGASAVFRVWLRISTLVLIFSLVGVLTLVFVSQLISNKLFNQPELTMLFRLAALGIPFYSLYAINAAVFQGTKRIAFAVITRNVLPSVLLFAFLWGWWFADVRGMASVVVSLSIASLLTYCISLFLGRGVFFSGYGLFQTIGPGLKNILTTSGPMLISSAMFMVFAWTDIVMLGVYRSTDEVGVYRVAMRLAMLIEFVLQAIRGIASPKFAELFFGERKEELRHVIVLTTRLVFWLTLPCVLGIVLLSRPLLLLFGIEFVIGQKVLLILILGQVANMLCGPVGTLLQMTGYQKGFQYIVCGTALCNIVLNVVFVPVWGMSGAACATAFSTTSWNIIAGLYVKKKFGYWAGYVPFKT